MGWHREEWPDHEGYSVGYRLEGEGHRELGARHPHTGELLHPVDGLHSRNDVPVDFVGAGCSCGWRSDRWRPTSARTHWSPCCVFPGDSDEAEVLRQWDLHLSAFPKVELPDAVIIGGEGLGVPLVRRDGHHGERCYLGDDDVHCGQVLELQLRESVWLRGRYEVQFYRGGEVRDVLHVVLVDRREAVLTLPPNAICRRPGR